MNIFMYIHFNIHSVFKTFRAFRLGHVILQLLQAPRSPPETFSGEGYMFILLINLCVFDTIYQRLYNVAAYRSTFQRTIKA